MSWPASDESAELWRRVGAAVREMSGKTFP